ncbi:MAG: hypothetical protein A3B25_01390 [Candidatus Ryanbacteria bacterium RIFCSPLOWO2_01_FULL_48_26]|uniref:Uncharacterized protein n=1 Tax=Candidatus Ryanbacteria bacterium RIFCSPLOWO2_01_FULL_48_26 TaxID=1802126 RepID=A0A1G2GUA0_9BACT|nr:MAG: hypothetical protein A3B25_01390 [Candidatus Ryanbacteria bacterium RIFCSPLOWO2_01_FULL_48_26]
MTSIEKEEKLGIIERMIRSVERWWALRRLQEATGRNLATTSPEQLAAGIVEHHWNIEFIKWLADSSLGENWIKRPIRLFRFKWRGEPREEIHSIMTNFYTSIIQSCIKSNFIHIAIRENGKECYHTTSEGDDFVSSYWPRVIWKLLDNIYAKTIILGLLGIIFAIWGKYILTQ